MTATEIKSNTTINTTTSGTVSGVDTSAYYSDFWKIPITSIASENYFEKYKAEKRKREEAENEVKYLREKLKKSQPAVKRILKNGDYMTVLWEDGTKTIVKRAEDEPASDYAAFTAALGIKVFGTNSELKRLVATAKEQGRKKNRAERSKDAEHTEGQGD